MAIAESVQITAVFTAILGVIHVALTMRVGFFRLSNKISLGDGGDDELLKRIRGHANFTETVPIALVLLLVNELSGLSATWMIGLGTLLVVGRLMHYTGLALSAHRLFRMFGMMATMLTILIASVHLLI